MAAPGPSAAELRARTMGLGLALAPVAWVGDMLGQSRWQLWGGSDPQTLVAQCLGLLGYLAVWPGLAWLALQVGLRVRLPGRGAWLPQACSLPVLGLWWLLGRPRPVEDFLPGLDPWLTGLLLLLIVASPPALGEAGRRRGLVAAQALGALSAAACLWLWPWVDPSGKPATLGGPVAFTWLCASLLAQRALLGRLRRWPRGLLAVALACLGPAGLEAWALHEASGSAPAQPNVLLITADTLRADVSGVYGGRVATPALAALAQRAVVFEGAHAAAPWTVPSLCSLFSSRFAPSLSPRASESEQNQEVARFAELGAYWMPGASLMGRMRERGYFTEAYVTNPALFSQAWLLSEFDRATVLGFVLEKTPPSARFGLTRVYRVLRWLGLADAAARPHDYTADARRHALSFLRRHRSRPFFLWVHFVDPHTPYDPPPRLRAAGAAGPFAFLPLHAAPEQLQHPGYIRDLYDAEARYVDEATGDVLAELRRLGLEDRTFVAFSADHGEELFDRGGLGHGFTLYEEQVRVPLLLAGPGIVPHRVAPPVSLIDLLPTFAELLGIGAEPGWRGRSLVPSLRSPDATLEPAPVFMQSTGLLPPSPEPLQAVLAGGHKLIRGMRTGTRTLHDLRADPGERRDLASRDPARLARLTGLLDAWQGSFPATFADHATGADPTLRSPVIERLRALGYAH